MSRIALHAIEVLTIAHRSHGEVMAPASEEVLSYLRHAVISVKRGMVGRPNESLPTPISRRKRRGEHFVLNEPGPYPLPELMGYEALDRGVWTHLWVIRMLTEFNPGRRIACKCSQRQRLDLKILSV